MHLSKIILKLYNTKIFLIITVHAKNEVDGLALTWAHSLFVMRALDFLPWVVPSTKTQQCKPVNSFPFSPTALLMLSLSLCSPFSFVPSNPPSSSFSSLIYSLRLVEGL